MTANVTSQAIEKWIGFMTAHRLASVAPSRQEAIAIAEKYRKMEEALKKIADHSTHCERYEMKPCDAEAKEALSFDPLSHD